MQIECKLIREGGTVAEIDGIEYHFAPQADGAHVAEVENDDHIDRFLSISEGYKLYRPRPETKAVEVAPTADGEGEGEGDEDEYEALRAAYKEKFGKFPHASMKSESIIAKLAEE